MKTKCSVYIAASLDGFIARPDGDIEWLNNPGYGPMGDCGLSYEAFISEIDAIVMGRNTFEKVLTFGFWPYEKTPVIVPTSRALKLPDELKSKVTVTSGEPGELVKELEEKGYFRLYIDGGNTIQRFLQRQLIDEITITQIPVLLGDGIPLFGRIEKEISLRLIETTACENGFVQFRYVVDN